MQPVTAPILPQSKGKEVANLQEALMLLIQKELIKVLDAPNRPTADELKRLAKMMQAETPDLFYGEATTALVKIFQVQQQLGDRLNGTVDVSTAKRINALLKELGALDNIPDTMDNLYVVSGTVLNSNGAALAGWAAEVLIVGVTQEIAAGKTTTGRKGEYSIAFANITKDDPDIQVKVYQQGEEKNFAKSVIKYNATQKEVLDVIVPATNIVAASEFNSLVSEVQPFLGQLKINELKEDDKNQHISYLSNKTGLDGRVTAMLASAHKLGTSLKLDPSHVYALLRSGVPATEDAIKTVALQKAEAAIKNAMQKNIIPASGNPGDTVNVLGALSAEHMLKSKTPSAISTMDEMLSMRLNTDQKTIFAQTQKQQAGGGSKLWAALEQKGFAKDTITQLQLDGKLGFLTGQNAQLVKRIQDTFKIKTDLELVNSGLYKAAEWKKIIGNDLPEGVTADEYAQHLASQVKMSYPTAVTGEMIKTKELTLGANTPTDELYSFFSNNQGKNNIGTKAVKTWDGFSQLSTPAKASAKMVERMFQLTPSDESMIALSKTGLSSAFEVSKMTKSEFLLTYGAAFPSSTEAEMTYNKAAEVYSASIGIATSYLTSRSMVNVYSLSGKLSKEQNTTVAYPTLEELLGNMDYCSCDHCKSVLSPAAYLVELLQFLDVATVPPDKVKPIAELLQRRPDIEHIQLSCENTNMALPYIDLVNEVLEHYVINGNLTGLKGHDITEEITQSELLAEPQFVNKTAYEELRTKAFPYNLPFHQPLETLRRLFGAWDLKLENMLSFFSTSMLARKETMNCSEDEYKTFTNINFKKLPEYFGEPQGNTIAQLNAAIANGKAFSRRTGISYEDLVLLLKTSFINPGFSIVPLFQKLQISLIELNKFYTGELTPAQLDDLIPDEISPAEYGGDIKQWLNSNKEVIMGIITLTDIGPEATECSFAEVELRYALPDNTKNALTEIAYHKFHRFLRLLRKTGWKIETLDNIIQALLPVTSAAITEANIDTVFIQLFDRMANFKRTADLLSYSENKYGELLQILDNSLATSLRQEQVAKLTKLSLAEMAELGIFAGINPLADDMEADEPSLLKFITTAKQLKEAALKIVDLAYILRHADLTGKLTVSNEVHLKNIKLLRDTLAAIEKDNSIAPDNADYNFAQGKMLQVYDAVTTSQFFSLLMGTNTAAAPLNTEEEGLPEKIAKVDPRLGFDPFKKQLTYTGILSSGNKTLLENAADALVIADMGTIDTQPALNTFIADFKIAVAQLLTNSNTDLTNFAASFPELKTIFDAVIAEATPAAQTKKLVDLILPELKTKLKTNAVRQSLIGILKSDPDTVNILTAKKENLRSVTDAAQTILHDFMQLEAEIDFDQNQTYRFYLDAPATDEYLIYITAPQNTVVKLTIDDQVIVNNATIGAEEEVKNGTPLLLKAGVLHVAELTIASLPANKRTTLHWRTKAIQKSLVPASAIYLNANVENAKTALIRLSKAAQIQNLFGFTPAELDYFASTNTETTGFLNSIDTNGTISTPNLAALWSKIKLLSAFNVLKQANEPEENTWLQVLINPAVKNTQNKLVLECFNLWSEADITALLTHFGFNRSDLSKLSALLKVAGAMAMLSDVYYPVADVLSWVTNDPTYDQVAAIKSTIKQKVTEAAWLETMQSVNDPVRNALRDALVSYILQYKKPSPEIINSDKLYEYFLIDVEMAACMQTSRIRLALSTVQLFIQRCLMNLEPHVDPASIRAEQWAWMKRYRVWEANRKVFLFPENWLEPELRDNKSSIFKELEGELLQAEITDESAELAFLNYLKKLDDIAKLDIIASYLEENEMGNQDDDILHVFGRTNGNTRQYYYRRYEYGYWTPWEKISITIEGEHLFPIVWRKKLFVFWLNIFEKPEETQSSLSPESMSTQPWGNQKRISVEINICWGEYFKGKWTSPKSTELKRPMTLVGLSAFDSSRLLIYGRKEKVENPVGKFRERVVLYVAYRHGNSVGKEATFIFTSKNAPPYIKYEEDAILSTQIRAAETTTFFGPYVSSPDAANYYFTQLLVPPSAFKVKVKQPATATSDFITEDVFTKKPVLQPGFSITPLRHPVENQFEAPFTYTDERSTFFVKPDEQTFIALPEYDDFYPVYEIPILYEDIPLLVDRPPKKWPPEEMVEFGEDVVINNGWEWNTDAIRTNVNYKKMLPLTDKFDYEGTVFDTAGKIKVSGRTNF